MNTIVKDIRTYQRGETVLIDVDVEIDMRRLAERLGQKAAVSKSGISRALNAIKVTVRR